MKPEVPPKTPRKRAKAANPIAEMVAADMKKALGAEPTGRRDKAKALDQEIINDAKAASWHNEAEALVIDYSKSPIKPAHDIELENLFSSVLRYANNAVHGLPYGAPVFSAVNNLRKVASDAHVERMMLRRRALTLEKDLAAAKKEVEILRFENVAGIKAAQEKERVLALIRMRLPGWAWRYFTRDPR
jgi:hypothetical protein